MTTQITPTMARLLSTQTNDGIIGVIVSQGVNAAGERHNYGSNESRALSGLAAIGKIEVLETKRTIRAYRGSICHSVHYIARVLN